MDFMNVIFGVGSIENQSMKMASSRRGDEGETILAFGTVSLALPEHCIKNIIVFGMPGLRVVSHSLMTKVPAWEQVLRFCLQELGN